MTVPVWLVDVDGVLNIIGWSADRVVRMWGDTRKVRLMGFQIVLSERMVRRIDDLRAEGVVDLRWLTTWEDLANVHLSPEIRWPTDLPVAGRRAESQLERPRKFSESRGDYREQVGWWKLEFARAVYDTGVPVIWTDDDIAFAPDALAWLETADKDRILAVAPSSGLTPDMLDEIERFIRRWNDQPLT